MVGCKDLRVVSAFQAQRNSGLEYVVELHWSFGAKQIENNLNATHFLLLFLGEQAGSVMLALFF